MCFLVNSGARSYAINDAKAYHDAGIHQWLSVSTTCGCLVGNALWDLGVGFKNNNKQETVNAKLADFSINKSSTDVEIKRITEILEKQYEIQLKTSKIKRNLNNEITAIKIDYKYKDGNEVSIVKKGDEPIDEIFINKEKGTIEFHKNHQVDSNFQAFQKVMQFF